MCHHSLLVHTRGAIYPDRAPKNWESLYGDPLRVTEDRPASPDRIQMSEFRVQNSEFRLQEVENYPMWQYGGKYIFVQTEGGLMMINQHRAHIAVLHAQFLEQLYRLL